MSAPSERGAAIIAVRARAAKAVRNRKGKGRAPAFSLGGGAVFGEAGELQRLLEDFFRQRPAAAAGGRNSESRPELADGGCALADRIADLLLGHRMADADVHGSLSLLQ